MPRTYKASALDIKIYMLCAVSKYLKNGGGLSSIPTTLTDALIVNNPEFMFGKKCAVCNKVRYGANQIEFIKEHGECLNCDHAREDI